MINVVLSLYYLKPFISTYKFFYFLLIILFCLKVTGDTITWKWIFKALCSMFLLQIFDKSLFQEFKITYQKSQILLESKILLLICLILTMQPKFSENILQLLSCKDRVLLACLNKSTLRYLWTFFWLTYRSKMTTTSFNFIHLEISYKKLFLFFRYYIFHDRFYSLKHLRYLYFKLFVLAFIIALLLIIRIMLF